MCGPRRSSARSAEAAFTGSSDTRERRSLLSKKLAGNRLFPVELEIGGKAAAEGAQPFQQFRASRLAGNPELPAIGNVDLDLIAVRRKRGFAAPP